MSHRFPGSQRRTKPVTTGTVAWPSKTPRRRNRSWAFRARLCAALRPMRYSLVSLIVLAAVPTPQAAAADPPPPRTSWGQPDLRGIWDFRTITPLQRPEDLGDTEILSAVVRHYIESVSTIHHVVFMIFFARKKDGRLVIR